MTIIKLSKSGKQLQIVDDFGNVYGIAVAAARAVLDGRVQQGFSMASKLPFNVSPERFGVSPVWNPEGKEMPLTSSITLTNDAFSAKVLNKQEAIRKFEDKEVW